MPVTVELVRDTRGLTALTSAWRELARRAARDELAQSPAWLLPWWEVFAGVDGRELAVLTVHDGGALIGLVPCLRRRTRVAPLVPMITTVRLEPLGTGEDEADEVCSDYTGMVAAERDLPRVADALATALAPGGVLADVGQVVWPGLADGPMAGEPTRALRRAGFAVTRTPTPGCPHIPLPPSWDAYLAALGQDRRYTVKRALRDFDAYTGGHHRLHVVTTPAELDAGLAVLRALHGERWRADGKTGVFASARFTRFLDSAAATLLAQGALELLWLEARDVPVAAVFNIVWDQRVAFYQAGRALDVPPKVKPGTVLHAFAIQRAIGAGLREYDFLAGESRYKRDLALAIRPLVTLVGQRPAASARLASWADATARTLARHARQLRAARNGA